MKVGRLNKRVTVYKTIETPDGGGGHEATPRMIGRSWCEIKPAGDYAVQAAAALKQEISHKILMRYRKDLTRECWIEYGNRKFEILSFKNIDERNRFLLISAKEKAA